MSFQISAEQLHHFSILRDWSRDELAALISHCELVEFSSAATMIAEGAEERALYFLLEGSAQVVLHVSHLGEKILAELPAGSVFGEVSFFHAAPHSATINCLAAAKVMKLSRAKYDELKAEKNLVALQLGANSAELLAELMQQTNVWIAEHLTQQEDRIVHAMWTRFRDRVGNVHSPSGGFRIM